MDFLAYHQKFIDQAMQLALKGQYTARPNPLVGCVLVQFDEKHRKPLVIGEGYHAYYGGPHAEIVALNHFLISGEGCLSLGNGTDSATN